jgi:uncharacterized coiled-coil DUF342 family protein
VTGLEIALRHAFNERDEEIARLRAEIATLTEQLLITRSNAETWRNSMYALEERVLELTEQRDRAMAVVRLYLNTYADTQKHPTASQEAAVIVAARAALDTPSSPSLPERGAL